MNTDLKIIKKMYGEKMMHLCRELFSTLLEQQGLLSKLILDNFAPSRFLYDDVIKKSKIFEFKNYIYGLVDVEKKEIKVNKTPKELLEEAGYDLYECKTDFDIQKFKKYYAKDEKLCTFNGGRLDRCHVFFAVKKNVNEIKRENFKKPERQDEYGTSVISIQFTKGEINTLSIKNRYNHRVNNPDATFSNNLENIIPGLTESFSKEYNLNINQNENNGFELDDYVKANDGKYYKYNYERNNIYYCPNNIIIDNFEVKKYDKERYIILDYFVFDLKEKTVRLYDQRLADSFIDGIKNIHRINISIDEKILNKTLNIETRDENKIIIEIDKFGQIISYKNNELDYVGNNFLYFNKTLVNLNLLKLTTIKDDFLFSNDSLTQLNLPNLKQVGNNFLWQNCKLEHINFPNLIKTGDSFLNYNENISSLNMPNLIEVGGYFIFSNKKISSVNFPKLQKAGCCFLCNNLGLRILELPELRKIGDEFLYWNEYLSFLRLPKLTKLGMYFLFYNKVIENLDMPELDEECRTLLFPRFKISSRPSIKQEIYGSIIINVEKTYKIALNIKDKIQNYIKERKITTEKSK